MSDSKKYLNRNLYMLKGRYAKRGYDWWWHSFTGYNKITGEEKPFFIEYYVINPNLFPNKAVLGQRSDNKLYNVRPSYVMIKAGCWGKDARQINNFYPSSELSIKRGLLNFQVGSCILTETELSGSVSVEKEEAKLYPECMTDAGTMSWNLKVNKKLSHGFPFRFPISPKEQSPQAAPGGRAVALRQPAAESAVPAQSPRRHLNKKSRQPPTFPRKEYHRRRGA